MISKPPAWPVKRAVLTWHGMNPFKMIGKPHMRASAMVPGPALVMMVSHAVIHSAMFVTNPRTFTLSPPLKDLQDNAVHEAQHVRLAR